MTRMLTPIIVAAALAAFTLPTMAQTASGSGTAGGSATGAGTAAGGGAAAGGAVNPGTAGTGAGNGTGINNPAADTTGSVNGAGRESANTKCQNAGGMASNMNTPGQSGGGANCK
ncbi:hypothetical protein [uncultured Alsobacter sp.]|uniref:hypothetical protein n=1 Tax=uncultured Alsobacter sp. TaxID=1748258 RepID=UPI0025E0FFC8|nr:hypothetical protein [uncultured Alsobacter sp.]